MKTRLQISVVSTVAILVLLPTGVMSQTYPDGMIGYWKFDEVTGDIALDSINENHGDIFGATRVDGQVGGALSFDGIDDYIYLGTPSQLKLMQSAHAVCSWANIDIDLLNSEHTILAWPWANREGAYTFAIRDIFGGAGKLWVELVGTGGCIGPVYDPCNLIYKYTNYAIPDGWRFLCYTWDGVTRSDATGLNLYVDGALQTDITPVCEGTISTQDTQPPGYATIGKARGGTPEGPYLYFNGLLDEIAVFNRALTATEIQQHYQNGYGGPYYCDGFQPPMASGPVTARGNRALPLKARLFDVDGHGITDLDLAAPPVIQVLFASGQDGDPLDVTQDAYPAGWGTEGNEFEYNLTDGVWQYNLKTKNYSACGTYTITIVSGDESEYIIDPACQASFEREE